MDKKRTEELNHIKSELIKQKKELVEIKSIVQDIKRTVTQHADFPIVAASISLVVSQVLEEMKNIPVLAEKYTALKSYQDSLKDMINRLDRLLYRSKKLSLI